MRPMANSLSVSQSEHLGFTLNDGSPNVLVHGGLAWRAVADVYLCPVHGAEVVPFGNTGVLVNGLMATCVGDFLLGAGPADIIMGANQVFIGDEGVGMASAAGMAAWCQEWCQYEKEWPGLTPDQRREKYKGVVGRMFGAYGAPAPNVGFVPPEKNADGSTHYTGGYVNVIDGEMGVGDQYFDASAPGDLRRVTYHETRHGEQLFNGMRYTRQQARDGNPVPGDNTASKNPAWVAAADEKGGFPPGSKEEAFARTHAHGFSRDEGIDQLGWANKDYGHRYPQIPGGADAAHTENKPASECKC